MLLKIYLTVVAYLAIGLILHYHNGIFASNEQYVFKEIELSEKPKSVPLGAEQILNEPKYLNVQIQKVEIFLSIFKHAHCLVHVTNFRKSDFPISSLYIPILIREPIFATVHHKKLDSAVRFVWTTKEWTRNTSISNDWYNCTYSDVIGDFSNHFGVCTRLLYSKYLLSSKPWLCEVRVALFPYNQLYIGSVSVSSTMDDPKYDFSFIYHEIWYYDIRNLKSRSDVLSGFDRSLSESSMVFQCAIVEDKEDVENWRRSIHQNLYVKQRTIRGGYATKSVILLVHAHITTTQAFIDEICIDPYMYDDQQYTSSCFHTDYWSDLKISHVQQIANVQPIDRIGWDIRSDDYTNHGQPLSILTPFFHKCNLRMKTLLITEDMGSELSLAYARILQIIMTNFSYMISHPFKCVLGERRIFTDARIEEKIELKLIIKDRAYSNMRNFGATIETPVGSYNFVSCAKVSPAPLAFKDLYGTFDFTCWLGLFGTVALVLLYFKLSANNSKPRGVGVVEWLVDLVKCLIEQSDINGEFQANHKLVVGSFLLVSVVLSNAYKSKNINNMLCPRHAIPFDSIELLVENKFNIFTEAIQENNEFHDVSYRQLNTSLIRQFPHTIETILVREGPPPKEILTTDVNKMVSLMRRNKFLLSNGLESAWRHARMMPESFNHFMQVVTNAFFRLGKGGRSKFTQEIITPVKLFHSLQMSEMERHLGNCNHTALILPSPICGLLKRIHESKNGKSIVSVGKKLLIQNSMMFSISGRIPTFMVKRMKGLDTAGIWEWTNNIVVQLDALRRINETSGSLNVKGFVRPTISGNISVLFVTLLLGHLFGICSILIEVVVGFHKKTYAHRSTNIILLLVAPHKCTNGHVSDVKL